MSDREADRKSGALDPGLAKRLHQALTAEGEALFQLVRDPAGEVLRASLKNPRIGEDHLLAMLQRRDLSEDLLKALYQHPLSASSHRLKVALVHNPATPGSIAQALLPHLHLFELLQVSFLPGGTPDQRYAADRAIIQRLPTTALGNKMTLARRASPAVAGALLKEGDPRLMEPCLGNPRLKEVEILQFLNGGRGNAESISMIARHPRWKQRPNVQLAVLKNPKTPPVWHTLLLPRMKTADLRNLLASRRLSSRHKKLVEQELKRRGTG